MKQHLILITVIVVVTISSSTAQNTEIERIDKLINNIEIKQKELNREKELLQKKQDSLLSIKQSLLETQYFGETFICEQSSYVFLSPETDYNLGYILNRNEKVKVIERVDKWYKIFHKGKEGYILHDALKSEREMLENIAEAKKRDSLNAIINMGKKLEREKLEKERYAKLKEERRIRIEKRKKELTVIYGATIANKIIERKIWLGMTDDMAIESWGKPDDINRTVSGYGTNEQWIYGDISNRRYLYFEDGILTTWQD